MDKLYKFKLSDLETIVSFIKNANNKCAFKELEDGLINYYNHEDLLFLLGIMTKLNILKEGIDGIRRCYYISDSIFTGIEHKLLQDYKEKIHQIFKEFESSKVYNDGFNEELNIDNRCTLVNLLNILFNIIKFEKPITYEDYLSINNEYDINEKENIFNILLLLKLIRSKDASGEKLYVVNFNIKEYRKLLFRYSNNIKCFTLSKKSFEILFERNHITKVIFKYNPKANIDLSVDEDMSVLYTIENGVLYISPCLSNKKIIILNGKKLFNRNIKLKEIVINNVVILKSMESMFEGCSSLTILKLYNMDTLDVTTMKRTFCRCERLYDLNLTSLNTFNVTNMSGMFSGCKSLAKLDMKDLDTRYVTDMSSMFSGCKSLTKFDIKCLDTRNVTNMSWMFYGFFGLEELYLTDFNTSKVTNMEYMFGSCEAKKINLSNLNVSNVTDMSWMFSDCKKLRELDMSGLDASNVTSMRGMFEYCESLIKLNLEGLKTTSVRDMYFMFEHCNSLETLDLSGLNFSSVNFMSGMFRDCKSLIEINMSGLDLAGIMDYMFSGCTRLSKVDFLNTNMSNAFSMSYMFENCISLKELDFSMLKAQKLNDISFMFKNCKSLVKLDLSNLNIPIKVKRGSAFYCCNSLKTVFIPKKYELLLNSVPKKAKETLTIYN